MGVRTEWISRDVARAQFHMVAEEHGNCMAIGMCGVGGALRWLLVISGMTISVLPPVATDIAGKSNYYVLPFSFVIQFLEL
jgi:hypothetical protein